MNKLLLQMNLDVVINAVQAQAGDLQQLRSAHEAMAAEQAGACTFKEHASVQAAVQAVQQAVLSLYSSMSVLLRYATPAVI